MVRDHNGFKEVEVCSFYLNDLEGGYIVDISPVNRGTNSDKKKLEGYHLPVIPPL